MKLTEEIELMIYLFNYSIYIINGVCGSLQCAKKQTSKYIASYTSMSNQCKFWGEIETKNRVMKIMIISISTFLRYQNK